MMEPIWQRVRRFAEPAAALPHAVWCGFFRAMLCSSSGFSNCHGSW